MRNRLVHDVLIAIDNNNFEAVVDLLTEAQIKPVDVANSNNVLLLSGEDKTNYQLGLILWICQEPSGITDHRLELDQNRALLRLVNLDLG